MQFPVERDTGIIGWDNHDGWGDPPIFDRDVLELMTTSMGLTRRI
jgi:hypothetical protein